jgi:hypothetical protein
MPVQLFTNNATTLLDADIDNVVTTLTVTTGEGDDFPNPTGGDWFYVTIESGGLREIVQVTARATDTFTIVRGQDGTSAASWTAGATIELRVHAGWLTKVHTTDSLPTAAIGDVVGPASAVDSNVAMFDTTSGKLIKDSGLTLSGSNTGDQTLSDATLSTTDITTNDVSTTKHGFAPKAPNDDTQFLNGVGAYSVPLASIGEELIINGNMNLWQRGTSFTTLGLVYHADQWEHVEVSDGSVDASRLDIGTTSAFHTASGVRLKYALRYDVNTADSTIVDAETVFVAQKIEGYRAQMYMHNQFTVSFYVRSNMTGAPNTFCFAVRNSDAGKSFVKEFTIDAADTWQRVTITVPTQDQTGNWNYVDGLGMELTWCLMSGVTFGAATDNVWNSSNSVATSNQVNWMATATNNFDLTGVQVDLGPNAQPLRVVPIERDLVSAERYYQKSYDLNVDPGATSALGQEAFIANGTSHVQPVRLRTPMRAAPTVALLNPTDGASNWERAGTGPITVAAADEGMTGFKVDHTTSVDLTEMNGHWTADATL